ncbi:MAG: hypothetical protein OXF41_22350 [bacterium]|nr:hypothetical protein [bacterium]
MLGPAARRPRHFAGGWQAAGGLLSTLLDRGFTPQEIAAMSGCAAHAADNPFLSQGQHLRVV